jgi:hypothetical protein
MNCAAAREAVLDCSRDVPMADDVRLALEEHLGGCANCAAELGWQRDLTAAFRGLSAEARAWNASSTIEDRLHEAFAARVAATPRPPVESKQAARWIYALASAAVIALAVWSGTRPSRSTSPDAGPIPAASPMTSPAVSSTAVTEKTTSASPTVEARAAPHRPVPVRAVTGRRAAPPKQVRSFEFITLPGAAGLPELESGSVVRIAVPVGALPEYGLDIVQGGSKTTVDADVLVGQDGLARAIRLVTADELTPPDTRSRQ